MQTRTSIASRDLVRAALLLAGSLLAPGGASADSFNWHSLNGNDWLSPARGQHYGDCHVFATFSILESKYKLTRNDPVYSADFAEWDFVRGMLAAGYWPGINYFSNGIGNAGRFSSGISTAVAGVAGEVDCRYDPVGEWGVGGWPLPAGTENRMYRSSTSGYVLATGATQQLKEQLKTYGPSFLRLSTGNDLFETVPSMYTTTRTPQNGPTNHWMALVGYQDDPNVPTGGYWILKNSWGPGWASSGYGYIPYGFLESHFNTEAPDTGTSFTGAVYYTGRLATADWKGGAGYWYAGGINWTKTHVNDVAVTPVAYAWENKETQANFGGAGGAVTISSTAIAHGMAINSDGYSFSGGRLTLSGSSTGTMADFDNETPYSWLLAQAAGTIDGFGYLDLDVSGFRNALAPAGYLRLSQNGDSRRIYLNYSPSVAGDANRDNYVDETDDAALAAHWGQSGGWTDGDFNGDGLINAPDASLLAANWGPRAAASRESHPVPEPAILALVAAGLLSLCGRTRRR